MFYVWLAILLSPIILLNLRRIIFVAVYAYLMVVGIVFIYCVSYWTYDNPQLEWAKHANWLLGVTLIKRPSSQPINPERTMFLGNHRGIADVFLFEELTEGSASWLATFSNAVYSPLAYAISRLCNSVWYFTRGGNADKIEEFYDWLDGNFECKRNLRDNLIVFPEGERSSSIKPLPLRSGMIRYAFSRQIPI
jgi:hypothetical protein